MLYLGNGKPIELKPIEMPPLGSAQIEVNETVRAMGYTDDAFGGAVFRYEAEHGGRLSVETAVAMPANNFLYSVESFTGFEKKSNAQHSAFWLPTSKTEVFYAAHNASDQAIKLRPKLRLWDEVIKLKPVEMAPNGFTKLRITAGQMAGYLAKVGRRGESVVGGITLDHDGPAEAVYATGWLDDASNGYSNMMSFADPAAGRGQALYGVQLFLGPQPGLAGPGKPLDMRTHVVLRNMSAGSIGVSASASFTRGDSVRTVPLPPLKLAAHAVEEYDLTALQKRGVIPRGVSEVLLRAEYFAALGTLMGRAYSISSDLTYGLYSVLESDGTGFWSGLHWSMQNDENTVFTIANIGEKEESVSLELAVPGGTVDLPEFKLLPSQTRTVNLRRDLQRMLRAAGKQMPETIVSGDFRVRSVEDPLRAELVTKEHVLSASKRTAAPFYGQCNYVTSVWLSINTWPVQVDLGDTEDVWPKYSWNVGGITGDSNAVLQPDGGNEISITPTYGLTRTIRGLKVGTRNMLLSSDVPSASDPCGSQLLIGSPPPAQVNAPTLSCPLSVTRGQSVNVSVTNIGSASIKWEFVDQGSTTLTKNDGISWNGVMVTSGAIRATVTPQGGIDHIIQCSITVNNRNWHTATPSAAQQPNGFFVTLPVPPAPSGPDSGLGHHRFRTTWQGFNVHSPSTGPNKGYLYTH